MTILPSQPPGPARRSSNARWSNKQLQYVVIALVAVAVLAVGYLVINRGGGSKTPAVAPPLTAAPTSAASPAQLLQQALQGIRSEKWVHIDTQSDDVPQGLAETTQTNLGAHIGDSAVFVGADNGGALGNTAALAQVGRTVYFRGDTNTLEFLEGFSPDQGLRYQDQWISLEPSDPPYAKNAEFLTFGALEDYMHVSSMQFAQQTVSNGAPAFELTASFGQGGNRGVAELFLSTAAPYLPVQYQDSNANGSTTKITFSGWGMRTTAVFGKATPYAEARG